MIADSDHVLRAGAAAQPPELSFGASFEAQLLPKPWRGAASQGPAAKSPSALTDGLTTRWVALG